MAAGLLRLGRLAQFLSESIMVGFVAGLACIIAIKQVPKLFGLSSGHADFWTRRYDVGVHLGALHPLTVLVAVGSLGALVLLERRFHKLPAALVVMTAAIVVSWLAALEARGVQVVGAIPAGFAPLRIPEVTWHQSLQLLPGAAGLALVSFAEALGPAHALATRHRYRIADSRELVGLGAANVGAGLFQGFPIGASLSKSAASDRAGAQTQVSSLVAAVVTALVALFLTPLLHHLPEATLAAIVVVAVSGMVGLPQIRRLYAVRRQDFVLAVFTFLGVLTFDPFWGLLVAVVASLAVLVWQTSQPRRSVLGRMPGGIEYRDLLDHPECRIVPEVLVVRPDAGIFFGNASSLRAAIVALAVERAARAVVVDMEATTDLDVPGADMLAELQDELTAHGIRLALARVSGPARQILERAGVLAALGPQGVFGLLSEAVLGQLAALGRDGKDADVAHIVRDLLAFARREIVTHVRRHHDAHDVGAVIQALEAAIADFDGRARTSP